MGNLARFTINLVGSRPPGFDANQGDVLTLKLEAPSGVVARWSVQVYGPANTSAPLASKAAPLLTLVGNTSGELVEADPSGTVTTTLPTSHPHSWIIRSIVNGGLDSSGRPNADYVFERIVSIRANGVRKIVDGERGQYAQSGFYDAVNDLIDFATLAPPVFGGDYRTLVSGGGIIYYLKPSAAAVVDTTFELVAGSGPTITLTGPATGPLTPIWVRCPTTGGALGVWQGQWSIDEGTNWIPFLSAASIPVTGTGQSLAISAGTANTAAVWKLNAATVNDIDGGTYDFTQATVAKRPRITKGSNRLAGVATDGISKFFLNGILPIPDPSITPTWEVIVMRLLALPGSNGVLVGSDSGFWATLRALMTGGIDQFNGTVANVNTGPVVNDFGVLQSYFSASVADFTQWNANAQVTGTSAGAHAVSPGRAFGANTAGNFPAAVELLMAMGVSHLPTLAERTDIIAKARAEFAI